MKHTSGYLLTAIFAVVVQGCGFSLLSTPTPLPGWRSPVSGLFVDDSAFPRGWKILFPEDIVTDPTVNYVSRSWEHIGLSGTYNQQIWRAYSVADAVEKYSELLNGFEPQTELAPEVVYVPFEPPSEIQLANLSADEFYLACGQLAIVYCQAIARYRNYVVLFYLSLESEFQGQKDPGLTYAEIENVLRSMDTKFQGALETLPTPPPN